MDFSTPEAAADIDESLENVYPLNCLLIPPYKRYCDNTIVENSYNDKLFQPGVAFLCLEFEPTTMVRNLTLCRHT